MTISQPQIHTMNLQVPHWEIRAGHLKLGGRSPTGVALGVNSYHVTLNDRPFIVVSGEFQPTRYPSAGWEEELRKIKAGGINTIAFYLFWIHHEEVEGHFEWSGDRDIRRFVELIAKCGLFAIVRVGPFVHGECRNGGLPDWLYGQSWEVRSNHPSYLAKVERYYNQLGTQLRGLFFGDGGPIVGIQLENEYESCGAPWDTADRSQPMEYLPAGQDGVSHIQNLRHLADQAGLRAPLLTLTGWDSPILENESLPVQGGYAYPSWVPNPEPSELYLFRDFQARPTINQRARYNPVEYPAATAELQGGMQVRANSRPVVPPRSTEALALVRLAGGANFLGYYVYHGGSNPRLKLGFPNETLHPQISYDYQAPIGEYGEVRDACRYLKIIHAFIAAFGGALAPMNVVLPEGAPDLRPTDTSQLRWCVRVKDGRGFVFLNNFQDHLELPARENFRLELQLPGETITIPARGLLTLPANVCCLLPFNFSLDGTVLRQATVQPLTVVSTAAEQHYIFFAPEGLPAQYSLVAGTLSDLAGDTGVVEEVSDNLIFEVEPGIDRSFTFRAAGGAIVRVTTLTRWQAEHAWQGNGLSGKCLVVSSADVTFFEGGCCLTSTGHAQAEAWIYPALTATARLAKSELSADIVNGWSHLQVAQPETNATLNVQDCGQGKWLLTFPANLLTRNPDAFLTIDYLGDTGAAFINGQLVADHYNSGTPWMLGLKRFWPAIAHTGLVLKLRPLRKGALQNISTGMAARFAFAGAELLQARGFGLTMQYKWELAWGANGDN